MNEVLLTAAAWAALVLISWFTLALLLSLLVGRSIAVADERELGPQSDTEAERSAA